MYTGNAVNALTPVAANDNFTGLGNSSRVDFDAQEGAAYLIALDGRNNSGNGTQSGSYALALQMIGTVNIATPTNGSILLAGAPIPVTVETATPNPPITSVNFQRNGTVFATVANPPYTTTLLEATPGTNSLSAVMTDGAGLSWTSAVVNVLVLHQGLTILSPADGATFLNTNPIAVAAVGLLAAGTLTNVEFFANGQKFGESTAPGASGFSAVWNEVTPGAHRLTVVGADDAGLSYTSAPTLVSVARTFVATGAVWKYLDTGTDQGTNWSAADFDDSTWTNGPAQFGYGDGDEATVVSFGPDAANKFTTTYFRHAFQVEGATGYTNIVLRVRRDDGAVVYLNGVEAARFNMPAGAIGFTTFASSTASDDGATYFTASVSAAGLVEGTNTLAVEIHQSDLSSSDISFDLELLGVPMLPRNQPPAIALLSPTNGDFFLAPISITLDASATDADGSVALVEYHVDGVKLIESTAPPHSFVWSNPPPGQHTLRAIVTDNEGARSFSAPATVTVYDAIGTPLVAITSPANEAAFQGPTNLALTASVLASRAVTNVHFFANDSLIGEAASSPFSLVWSNATYGTNLLSAVAFDATGIGGTSAVVTVVVNPPPDNSVAPFVFSANPPFGAAVGDLTSIQVTFSERVTGVVPSNLLINGVAASSVSGAGSNYTFSFAQPPYGPVAVRWAGDTSIFDMGIPPLPFDAAAPGAVWNYTLLELIPPVVAAKSPSANATVTNLTELSVTFSEPVSGVNAVDLLINGGPADLLVGGPTTFTFSFAQPPSGAVNVSWAGDHAITDLAVSSNAFNATGPGATWSYTLDTRTILVQSNANWQFIKGLAEASTPADAWRAPAFDDAGWSNAPTPFYYGDPYNTAEIPGTLLSDMQNNYTSIYLRRQFTVANLSAVTNLLLTAQSDDGFLAWINGVEVVRFNLPAGEVPFSAVTLASTSEPNSRGAAYLNYTLPDPAAYLVEGANVLTIHAFNQSLTASSDFGFNLQLYTYLADASVAAPRLASVNPPLGELFSLTNLTITFTEPVTGVDAGDLLINGQPADLLAGGPATYTFTFAQPVFGEVVVSWATNHGIADFDATPRAFDGAAPGSTWTYTLLNPSRPTVAARSPSAGATVASFAQLTVTFSEAVTGVDAGDLLINGGPADLLTGGPAEYTFTFAQPVFGPVSVSWATNHGIEDLELPTNTFDETRPDANWSYLHVDPVPVVALVSPVNGAVFQTPVNVTLQASATDADGFIARVEFFAGGEKLGEATAAPFTFVWRNAPVGDRTLLAVATDNSGLSVTSAPVSVTIQQGPVGLVLSGAIWKYLDNGSDQSNAWREVNFDDTAWASGPSELGYGDGNEATVVSYGPDANNKFITTYFRHTFVVTDATAITNLALRLLRDDGAAVYLNGNEILRDNLAPDSPTNYLTLATTNVVGADEARFFQFGINPALLVSGTNVLAAEVHQQFITSGSADMSFNLELIANTPPAPPTVALTSPANNSVMLAPASVTLSANAADTDGTIVRVEFFESGNRLGVTTNAPFTLVWPNVPEGVYTLLAVVTDNSGLTASSATVRLTVTNTLPVALVRGPYLQIGTPTGGLVRWRTDVATDAAVFYGVDAASLTNIATQAVVTNEHIVQLTGLQPDTRYFYAIGTPASVLAGGSNFWFVTAPVPGTKKPTRIWAIGDAGTAGNGSPDRQGSTRDAFDNFAAATRPADLWLMLGDNAYNSGTDSEYQSAVFNMYPNTLRNTFLWPTIGNHETAQSTSSSSFPYLNIFSLPQNGEAGGTPSGTEKYYSFDYANIHFISLDSMTSGRTATSPMAQWLQDDLAATAQDWIIVYFHHPPYTKGSHDSDAESDLVQIRQNLIPILEAGGVDLVLNGHSHCWERSFLLNGHYGNSSTITESMKLNGGDGRETGTGAYQKSALGEGVVYTVAGNAGQATGGPLNHPAHFRSLNELGTMVIDVTSNRLDAIFLSATGEARDQFTLLKPSSDVLPPAAPLDLVARALGTNQIALGWTDAATNELGFHLERSTDGTNFALLASLAANITNALDSSLLLNTTYFYRVRAFNSAGVSEYSGIASATTIAPTGVPRAPTDLLAHADNGVEFYRSQIILRWRDRSTNEAGFLIERSTDGDDFAPVGSVGANVTLFVNRSLASATSYYYRVRAFHAAGESAPSNLAGETTHPQSDLALAGEALTFHAGAEGLAPVRYQWRFFGASIFGETNEALTISNAQLWDEGAYSVVIVDGTGRLVSNPAWLFVLAPPLLVEQPASRTNTPGSTATFQVSALGEAPLLYQWRRNGTPLAGAQDWQLTIPSVQLSDGGDYDVIVENELGAVTSQVARLVINLPPVPGADQVYRPRGETLALEVTDLLANDSDPDGDAFLFTGFTTNTTQGGTAARLGRYLLYTPANGFEGDDTITYFLTDARGGIGAGLVTISVTDNTPPAFLPIPDFVAQALTPLVFTNAALDATTNLTYSLGAGAPENARINPETGVFRWTPTRAQAPSTNVITVRVEDDGVPVMSDARSFVVVVRDYMEIAATSAVLRDGTSGSVLVEAYSSTPLTSLSTTLHYPAERLTNFWIETLSAAVATATLDLRPDNCAELTFTAPPGQSLWRTQQLARLHFTAVPNQSSAFVPLRLGEALCTRAEPGLLPNALLHSSRVAVIGRQPLLEALDGPAAGTRHLMLYGRPQTAYRVEKSETPFNPGSWSPWRSLTLSNLFESMDANDSTNAPTIFYRARE